MTDVVGKTGLTFPSSSLIRSVTIPYLTGLFAEFWLGVDGPTSKHNHAVGGTDLIDLAGGLAPTYASNYATVKGTASLATSQGLDSAIVAPNACTVAVLQRQASLVAAVNSCRVFGTDTTGVGGNSAASSNNFYSGWNGHSDGAFDEAHVAYGAADVNFHLVVMAGIIGSPGNVRAYTGGVASTDVATATAAARDATTFKLGGFLNGKQGQVDVAWAAAWNGILTAAQMDDLYSSIKSFGSFRGLTVS